MFSALFVVLLTGILYFTFWCVKQRRKFKSVKCIPGPKILPVLGNVLDLGIHPVDTLKNECKLLNTHGTMIRVWIGPSKCYIITSDPDFTEFILTSPKYITKGVDYRLFEPWLNKGLLTSTGGYWQKRRKAITPTFHFKILEEFIPTIARNSDILTSRLAEKAEQNIFDMYPYVTAYALDNICETSMGTPVHAQKQPDNDYVKAVKGICELVIGRAYSAWKNVDVLFKFSRGATLQNQFLNVIHGFTRSVIEKRRADLPNKMSKLNENTDDIGTKRRIAFLDLLLEARIDGKPLSNEDIREEVDTFMFEGHDTTASAICFAFYELARNPDVQEKLMNEIHELFGNDRNRQLTQSDLSKMKYTELVLKETLRLYPSVPYFIRQLTEDTTYKGILLPKGLQIMIMVYAMHRRPDLFKDPEKFKPERFVHEDEASKHPFAYVPFSAGPRNCIGQKFAMNEMKITLYKVLSNYKLLPAGEDHNIILSGEVILKSANGVSMRLEKR